MLYYQQVSKREEQYALNFNGTSQYLQSQTTSQGGLDFVISYEDLTGNSVTPTGSLLTLPELELQLIALNNSIVTNTTLNINDFIDYSGTTNITSTLALAANVNRKYLLIQNVSDTDIWINFNLAATTGSGSIKLSPDGHYELSSKSGGYINTSAVNVISSIAGKEFTIKEA